MFEILKKAGVASGIATVLVLAITFVPVYFQFKDFGALKAEVKALKAEVEALKAK